MLRYTAGRKIALAFVGMLVLAGCSKSEKPDLLAQGGPNSATQVAPGEVIEFRVPDMFNRPWARIWEEFFEQEMERPTRELNLGFD